MNKTRLCVLALITTPVLLATFFVDRKAVSSFLSYVDTSDSISRAKSFTITISATTTTGASSSSSSSSTTEKRDTNETAITNTSNTNTSTSTATTPTATTAPRSSSVVVEETNSTASPTETTKPTKKGRQRNKKRQKSKETETKNTTSSSSSATTPTSPTTTTTTTTTTIAPTPSTTDTTATTITTDNATGSYFYEYYMEQLKSLINIDTVLQWHVKTGHGYWRRWLENFGRHSTMTLPDKDWIDLASKPDIQTYNHFYANDSLCPAAKAFLRYRASDKGKTTPLPHILSARLNNDYGAFSSYIPGKTRSVLNLTKRWSEHGCNESMIFEYINHKDTLAVFTNQFQVYRHPKVISLPLGFNYAGGAGQVLDMLKDIHDNPGRASAERPYLMMLNSRAKNRPMRTKMVGTVVKNFKKHNITLQNTYGNYGSAEKGKWGASLCTGGNCYYNEMLQSKFILTPPGLGLDCYRIWEALYLGTIPVIETGNRMNEDGWLSYTLQDLPISFIEDYKDLTPAFLEAEYQRITSNPQQFNFKKLTRQYWIQMAKSFLEERADADAKSMRRQLKHVQESVHEWLQLPPPHL